MSTRRFRQVDVFTAKAGYGNGLAVVLDSEGVDTPAMQRFASWTNLSETTFVLPPTSSAADYRLRIFTPRSELPFAGHPSVGTAHALIEAGIIPSDKKQLVQECAAGLLPVRVVGDGALRQIFVRAPQMFLGDADMMLTHGLAKALAATLKSEVPPIPVTAGPTWLVVNLETARAVRTLKPDLRLLAEVTRDYDAVGVAVFGRELSGDAALAVRVFCPADGIDEDPVTGSANACIGAYLNASGALETLGYEYMVSQGREIGRDGFVYVVVNAESGAVEIGGHSVTCIEGSLAL
jgi:PhzF family phenazine biosynthesis protein